jgi:hypothetical protein
MIEFQNIKCSFITFMLFGFQDETVIKTFRNFALRLGLMVILPGSPYGQIIDLPKR